MTRIYLDHNATTPPLPAVVRAMAQAAAAAYGNPSARHAEGRTAARRLARARRQVAALVHAAPDEVVFVSGGSEADNQAVFAAAAAAPAGRRHIVATAVEHAAVLEPCRRLEREGWRLTLVRPGSDGCVSPEAVAAALDAETALVAVMLANNETGALLPVAAMAPRVHAAGALLLVDAVQAAGRVPVEFGALGADLLALSAHKLYGPKGAGALVVRRGLALPARILGGRQEERRRAGTENVPAIAGFGVAAGLARRRLRSRAAHDRRLRDRLERGLCAAVPGLLVHAALAQRLPNTLYVSFPQMDGASMAEELDRRGIAVSTGAACGAGDVSHVLRAMGLPPEAVAGSVRFSLGIANTAAQVDAVLAAVREIVRRHGPPPCCGGRCRNR
jgi:cysteine desulfurase